MALGVTILETYIRGIRRRQDVVHFSTGRRGKVRCNRNNMSQVAIVRSQAQTPYKHIGTALAMHLICIKDNASKTQPTAMKNASALYKLYRLAIYVYCYSGNNQTFGEDIVYTKLYIYTTAVAC